MTTNTHTTMGWYNDDSAEQCTIFYAKIKAEARAQTDKNVYKVLLEPSTVSSVDDRKTAQATLYDLLVKHIKSPTLLLTLEQSYEDEGHQALQYNHRHSKTIVVTQKP